MFKTPGVYVQDVVSGSQSITQASSSVGILFGKTRSGKVNIAQKVGSWTEFISKYANGLDTPFIANDYLAYAVHGFFSNGGKELYIGSIKKDAKKATIEASSKNALTVTASNEGLWGNDIKVEVKKDTKTNFINVTVSVGTNDSVVITNVTVEDIALSVMSNNKVKKVG